MNIAKKTITKICAILIIITLTISDFLFVGITAISYAVDVVKTNSSNVNFSAYFLDSNGEKVEKLEDNIDKGEEYLYVEISVYNDGYFNGVISFNNNNFNVKEDILSSEVAGISDNTVTLNQINAGSTVTIKVAIESKSENTITKSTLETTTEVLLTGEYVNSKNVEKDKYVEIKGTAEVEINWKSSADTNAELDASLLTNSIYEEQGEEKRIIQILVHSKITNNNYPVQNTEVTLAVPNNVEEVNVHARSTSATNSGVSFGSDNYTYDKETGTLKIQVSNEDTNNISWNKDVEDTFVITYIFGVDSYIAEETIGVSTTITTYDEKTLVSSQDVHIEETENIDGAISYAISTEEESIYKGKIYTGEERDYTVVNTINVDYLNVVESINVKGNEATYLVNEQEVTADIYYKETRINKEKFLEIFGENGYITIKDNNGVVIANITSNSETDENGNVIINYYDNTKNIEIITSEPIKIGTLNIEHTKYIQENNYTRNEINYLTGIKETITGTDNGETITADTKIELKNTSSKANLEVSTDTLATTETNENVKITAVLLNNDESKDLYQNPVVKITLPKQVTGVTAKCKLLYGNGLELSEAKLVEENGSYVIEVNLSGTQSSYNTETLEGTTIIIYANMELNKLAVDSDEEIKLTYTNEIATSYEDNGEESSSVKVVANSGIITTNNIEEYNLETIGDQGTQTVTLPIESDEKDATVNINVINNEGTTINDIAILGKFPTSGDTNLGIAITSEINILSNTENVKIYYSDNENATTDLTDSANKWKTELNANTVKTYLITIDNIAIGESFEANYSINIPADLTYNLATEESYTVSYTNALAATTKEINSTIVSLSTGTGAELATELKAYVGGEQITEEDTVYTGEVIKYELTVTNNGTEAATNVNIEATVPENTTCVQYVKSTEITETDEMLLGATDYYKEISESTLTKTYETLEIGETKTISYEIRIDDEAANNTITSEVLTTYNATDSNSEITTETNKISSKIAQADISMNLIMVARGDDSLNVGTEYSYSLTVTNKTDEKLSDVKVNISTNGLFTIQRVLDENENSIQCDENVFTIDSLDKGATVTFEIDVLANNGGTATISTIANDLYKSNMISETIEEANVSILMSSENEGETVNNGDELVYNITVTNNGTKEIEYFEIQQKISTYLDVENITINGKEINFDIETIANNTEENDNTTDTEEEENDETVTTETEESDNYIVGFNYTDTLDSGESLTIVVTTSSDSTLKHKNNIHMVSVAELALYSTTTSSEEVNHILVSNTNDTIISDEEDNELIQDEDEDDGGDTSSSGNINNNENNSSNEGSDGNEGSTSNEVNSENGTTSEDQTYTVSGTAWLDKNEDGQRDSSETTLNNIKAILLNLEDNSTIESTTTDSGFYSFTGVKIGKYVVIFEYDTDLYMLTTYQADGVSEARNSDVENVTMNINGTSKQVSATDTIEITTSSATNIDIGLIEAKTFDLSLEKTVTKVSVTNNAGTSTTEYDNTTLAKVEVKAKYLESTTVVIEYNIKVTNEGEVAGYVKNIADYKPSDLNFSSSLNPEWYQSGEYLYSTSLANEKIEAGETKELTLILTKTMTETNTGLVNNTAEISEDYNSRGISDSDSTPGNRNSSEDDMGSANTIISVSTGAAVSYIALTLTVIVLIAAIAYIVSKKVLKEDIKF